MKQIFLSAALLLLSVWGAAQNKTVSGTTTEGTLTVTSTISMGNTISAVWINNDAGYLRTLYAGSSSGYVYELGAWTTESDLDVVNATTGATKTSVWSMNFSWNGKDKTNTSTQPDGQYTVKIENAHEGAIAVVVTASITKGPTAQTVTATNKSPITNVTVKWVPASTGLDEIKLARLYSIYPNPTRSSIFVNGFDIQSITIFSLSGKQLIRSVEPRIDLSGLDKGVYLAQISTSRGTFAKKVVKE